MFGYPNPHLIPDMNSSHFDSLSGHIIVMKSKVKTSVKSHVWYFRPFGAFYTMITFFILEKGGIHNYNHIFIRL